MLTHKYQGYSILLFYKAKNQLCQHKLLLLFSRSIVIKTNIETNILEDYVNFVDTKTRQNTYFKKYIVLFVLFITLFLVFLLFKY